MTAREIAETLARARHDQGLTQRAVAERIGVVVGAVGNWETGSHVPSLASLLAWADALGHEVTLIPKRQQEKGGPRWL